MSLILTCSLRARIRVTFTKPGFFEPLRTYDTDQSVVHVISSDRYVVALKRIKNMDLEG